MVHAFNPFTLEAEAEAEASVSHSVKRQHGLHSKLQASRGYTVRPLKKIKNSRTRGELLSVHC